ncbi:respiratory nitrate reductase subunit gamma [Georgenia thermotolerans]|uniref:Nitrate reductase-like protein NarX n=1 Tax=Georgenia thermotolerans TaxID=527326 RepID=A0A7J5UKD0_9MICO|nr:respiratory nitrate reductase subunit gamma [Georgenia thermotolerans]KAE8762817.1 respiratory nitrate reductase subunit gamma [Georgenia thermotolerans]
MSAGNILLWVVFPYVSMAVFVVGTIWRYRYDKFGWTTRSSELYEKTILRLGSPLFHFGILFVALGHFMGLLIPESWTEAVGFRQEAYHFIATYMGSVAGVATVVGLAILIYRRRTTGPVFLATTRVDKLMYVLLALPILLGLWATVQTQLLGGAHGYDYRQTISPWLRSLFYLQPQAQLMTDVPLPFKLHVTAAFLLFLAWPFTRLVHAFSAPLPYATRPYIVYRSREAGAGARPSRRGWEASAAPQGRRERPTSTRT